MKLPRLPSTVMPLVAVTLTFDLLTWKPNQYVSWPRYIWPDFGKIGSKYRITCVNRRFDVKHNDLIWIWFGFVVIWSEILANRFWCQSDYGLTHWVLYQYFMHTLYITSLVFCTKLDTVASGLLATYVISDLSKRSKSVWRKIVQFGTEILFLWLHVIGCRRIVVTTSGSCFCTKVAFSLAERTRSHRIATGET